MDNLNNEKKSSMVTHVFKPIFDENSKILILGTMPSPKSREVGFYYGHPRNRFWKVVSEVCNEQYPNEIKDKIQFLLRNNIAIWDVLKSCEIKGADDGSIRNPLVNDLNSIIKNSHIKAVFTTGQKATSLYEKYCYTDTNIHAIMLPSTSSANCSIKYEELVGKYNEIKNYL